MQYTITDTPLQQAIQGTEQVLHDLDIQGALLDARMAAIGDVYQQPPTFEMTVRQCAAMVTLLTRGGTIQWCLTTRYFHPNPAIRYAAIVMPHGVYVYRCDALGWLCAYVGRVDQRTTRRDVWRMRQNYAAQMAHAHGLMQFSDWRDRVHTSKDISHD